MTYAKKLHLIAVGAIIVLSAGTAAAQLPMPGIDLLKENRPLDPAEEAKRKAVDDAYKSTMKKLPDQKNQTTLGETFVRQQKHLRRSDKRALPTRFASA